MTPSNQHSAEAQAAQAERQALWEKRNPDYRGEQIPAWSDSFMEGFDRGRASVPVSTITDRERLIDIIAHALRPDAFWNETALYPTRTREDWEAEQAVATIEAEPIADAILADPAVPLVSTREAIAKVISESGMTPSPAHSKAITDALLSSGVLVDRGESDAQALQAFADSEFARNGATLVVERALQEVARLRSGKAET